MSPCVRYSYLESENVRERNQKILFVGELFSWGLALKISKVRKSDFLCKIFFFRRRKCVGKKEKILFVGERFLCGLALEIQSIFLHSNIIWFNFSTAPHPCLQSCRSKVYRRWIVNFRLTLPSAKLIIIACVSLVFMTDDNLWYFHSGCILFVIRAPHRLPVLC